jgi:hypothetical protein
VIGKSQLQDAPLHGTQQTQVAAREAQTVAGSLQAAGQAQAEAGSLQVKDRLGDQSGGGGE